MPNNDVDTPIVVSGRAASVDDQQQTISVTALMSPNNPIMDNGLNAYFALGLVSSRASRRVFIDQQEERELALSDNSLTAYLAAGIVYPTKRLRFYAVAEIQDELWLSIGARWHITKAAK